MPITMDTSPGGGVYQTATHLLSLLPPGIKVHIECGNECWNSAYATYTWCRLQQSILQGASTGNAQLWYANACKAIHDQCIAAFTDAGRPDDLIRVVGSQATQPGVTAAIATQLQTIGAEFEELCIAPYFANWPASYYGTDQYPIFNGMTIYQLCYYFEFISLHGGWDTSQITIHRPVLDSYGYNAVNIVAYECGFTNFVPVDPVGQPPGNDPNYAIRQNAVMQNPRMYGVCLQFAQQYQDAGLTHCEWFDVGGGTGFNDWGLYVSGNQQRGTGDPSLDTVNVSNPQAKNQVLAEEAGGWHHWATLSTPPKVTTTNKITGGRNGQLRTIGYPRGMYRPISHH
jgi:hypothetical protein